MRSLSKPFNFATKWYREAGSSVGLRLIAILVSFFSFAGLLPALLQAAAQPTAHSSIRVEVEQGRLTLTVRDAPLVDVLQAVAKQAGIAIKLYGEFTDRITHSFTDIALEEGIRRLLRGQSFALSYAPSAKQANPGRLVEVTVIARSLEPERAAEKVSPRSKARHKWQTIRALSRRNDAAAIAELSGFAARDPSASVRRQAVAALGTLKNREALAPLKRALADHSAAVRIEAMRGIKSLDGVEAIRDLHAMLVNDTEPMVRRQALRLLSELQSPEALRLLQGAIADHDATVRQEAKQAMQRWERRFGAQQ